MNIEVNFTLKFTTHLRRFREAIATEGTSLDEANAKVQGVDDRVDLKGNGCDLREVDIAYEDTAVQGEGQGFGPGLKLRDRAVTGL